MESYNDQQYDDPECVPPLPDEEDVSMSSSAIDVVDKEQPTRASAFSRRMKVVAAIVVVVAIAAVAIGVGLVAKPSGGTSAAQSSTNDEVVQEVGASQNENLDEAVVATTQNDSVSDETSSNNASPQDQQETTIGTETDIIYDGGYEQTSETWSYSGPTMSFDPDSLQEGIFVSPPEEKVPLESDVLEALETVTFDGPLTNFIRTSLSAYNGACTDPNQGEWFMQLTTDLYPWENRWEMISEDNEVIMSGPPEGRNYDRTTTYIGTMCVPKGTYTMRLVDKGADGICCGFGNGKMIVKVNDEKVLETGNSSFGEFSQQITVVPANTDNNTNTPPPTPKPTPKPTPVPVAPLLPSNLVPVTVKVRTDNFGGETGYKLVNLDNGEVLLNKRKGTLSSNQLYEDLRLVEPGGRYEFTVSDNYNGIEPNGYYSIDVDGEEIMYGGRFRGGTKSVIIRPGFTPENMSNNDRLWLDEHNSRRQAFHVQNGGQGAYNRLVWSNELEASARAWVEVISPTCTLKREPGLDPGENIALRNASPKQIGKGGEGPETIVRRWVDQKIGLGYPGNQSATQALWRGTRFVGCHSSETDLPDGNKCYVSICRYAQAGNCDMSKVKGTAADGSVEYDWTAAVMADRSRCGPTCPVNSSGDTVCY